jgi:hypothetical protein
MHAPRLRLTCPASTCCASCVQKAEGRRKVFTNRQCCRIHGRHSNTNTRLSPYTLRVRVDVVELGVGREVAVAVSVPVLVPSWVVDGVAAGADQLLDLQIWLEAKAARCPHPHRLEWRDLAKGESPHPIDRYLMVVVVVVGSCRHHRLEWVTWDFHRPGVPTAGSEGTGSRHRGPCSHRRCCRPVGRLLECLGRHTTSLPGKARLFLHHHHLLPQQERNPLHWGC